MEEKDRLNQIWQRQLDFNRNFFNEKTISIKERQARTKDMILCLIAELTEVLENINYKEHENKKEVDIQKVKEEIIDVFKYTLCLMQAWNFSDEELFSEFQRKSEIVENKFKNGRL